MAITPKVASWAGRVAPVLKIPGAAREPSPPVEGAKGVKYRVSGPRNPTRRSVADGPVIRAVRVVHGAGLWVTRDQTTTRTISSSPNL